MKFKCKIIFLLSFFFFCDHLLAMESSAKKESNKEPSLSEDIFIAFEFENSSKLKLKLKKYFKKGLENHTISSILVFLDSIITNNMKVEWNKDVYLPVKPKYMYLIFAKIPKLSKFTEENRSRLIQLQENMNSSLGYGNPGAVYHVKPKQKKSFGEAIEGCVIL